MRYDIAIVGSGPAGLSAAINAKIRNKNIIVFGTESLSNKLVKAQSIDNYLGFNNPTSISKTANTYFNFDFIPLTPF